MFTIFVLEPDDKIRSEITSYLKLEDYSVESSPAPDGIIEKIEKTAPDLILMEAVFPEEDGFIAAKEIKQHGDIPLIFVTEKDSESDRILGFEIGADDYISKPFSPKEMLLRINAVLRRVKREPKARGGLNNSHSNWELNGRELKVNLGHHKLYLNGEEVELTATEWKVLVYLIENAHTVVSRDQILDSCLEYKFEGYDRTVDSHIKNIRSKLNSSDWIETIRGYGYRFCGAKV